MKKVILLALMVPSMAFGQVVENFEAQTIASWKESTAGRWKADTTSALSGLLSLHHIFDNPDASVDCIGLPMKDLHPDEGTTTWSFVLRYGTDPSSVNFWTVSLMSDSPPLQTSTGNISNSFMLGVNLTGSDDTLRLWKVKGSAISQVVSCRLNWQTDIGASASATIKVRRSATGLWTVTVANSRGVQLCENSGIDAGLFSPDWFNICYHYSSTRDRLLWFDDLKIDGIFYNDITPPSIKSCVISKRNAIDLTFSEQTSDSSLFVTNISVNENNNCNSVKNISANCWRFTFQNDFQNKKVNRILFGKVCDRNGNCTRGLFFDFLPQWAERGDVVISEVMARPYPSVSLPEKEYLEIFNRSEISINLKNWQLGSASSTTLLPDISLDPSTYTILCATGDTSAFAKFGKTAGVRQFPSLTDEGKLIWLADSTSAMIHSIEYSDKWYRNDLKKEGGWSLEMRNAAFPFAGAENWIASSSSTGGTPGRKNSFTGDFTDSGFYGISNIYAPDSSSLVLSMSEPQFDLSAADIKIDAGTGNVLSVTNTNMLYNEFILTLRNKLQRSKRSVLELNDRLTDFAGNHIQVAAMPYGLSETAGAADLVFNELLFNPMPGDPDFIELANISEKIIDPARLNFVSVNDETGGYSAMYQLSICHRCIFPGDYYAVTTGRRKLIERYSSGDSSAIFEVASLVSMPDDKGHLLLLNRELGKIDEVIYNDRMHFSLLASHQGVSLEKKDPKASSLTAANWHSASSASGWATPGAANTVLSDTSMTDDKVSLSTTRITPDSDGNDDFVSIDFRLNGNGNVISVTVFDETGYLVKKLAENILAGNRATVTWDGTNADGSLAEKGIYILFITFYNDSGKQKSLKKVCTVLR